MSHATVKSKHVAFGHNLRIQWILNNMRRMCDKIYTLCYVKRGNGKFMHVFRWLYINFPSKLNIFISGYFSRIFHCHMWLLDGTKKTHTIQQFQMWGNNSHILSNGFVWTFGKDPIPSTGSSSSLLKWSFWEHTPLWHRYSENANVFFSKTRVCCSTSLPRYKRSM